MKKMGISSDDAKRLRDKYGSNELTKIPPDPLWKKILEGFKDPMIMILLVALAVQIILFFFGQAEWFEPVSILIAILIANGVASISENKQENKVSVLREEEEAKEKTKVIRDNALIEIHTSEVVVGDIVFLQAGDKIPADGIIQEGKIKVDQSALNGETEEAEKKEYVSGQKYDTNDLLNPYYAYRGTVVCDGEAYMEIQTVGDHTLFGKLALEVQEETRETPLQVKLGKLAKQISTFGYIGAIAIVLGILLKVFLTGETPQNVYAWIRLIMDAVTVAVTIIVCAVPEGLPMLTSILLAFQSLRMAKDNVLVRKINGLETAGSLDILFSDKTGTITEGKLSVAEFITGDSVQFQNFSMISSDLGQDIITGIGVNNRASANDNDVIGGNSTDRALLAFLVKERKSNLINKQTIQNFHAFDSNKKYSHVTVLQNGKEHIYLKGAPEKIVERCTQYVDTNGSVHPLTNRNLIDSYMNEQASRSMRLLAVAKGGSIDENAPLTLICIISIRDNVRKDAADAIQEVQNAGVQVVMVTGDRKETAIAIAKASGITKSDKDIALTSAEMAEKPIPRKASIISKSMFAEVILGAVYITVICLGILFFSPLQNLFGNVDVTYLKSALFATFMMAITFNGFNARTEHINVFEHIGRNRNFLIVMLVIFLVQFIFVTFGGSVLGVESLTMKSWAICAVLAFLIIPLDMLRKIIVKVIHK